jgi:Spy/CpxP family protein refolding chaperone
MDRRFCNRVPTVEEHLKLLTAKLDLTAEQQDKIKPILQDLHDATQKLVDDQTESRDERLAHVRPLRYKADKEICEVLNDDQKKKLDQLEQQSHAELHGNLNGATPPPQSPQN